MTQADKAHTFAGMHKTGSPLKLFNIWDAGSAKAVAEAGAQAVATGSWSVAGAQGYADGEKLPLDLLLTIVSRIAASVDIPVSVDFEGGYARDPETLAKNVTRLIQTGVIGINFEDQIVGGEGLYDIKTQQSRIAAIRDAADQVGISFFINARTDIFLKNRDGKSHPSLMSEALERGQAYAEAGASGYFIPLLDSPDLIAEVCTAIPLPINTLKHAGTPSYSVLERAGVSRISHGEGPWADCMSDLATAFGKIA